MSCLRARIAPRMPHIQPLVEQQDLVEQVAAKGYVDGPDCPASLQDARPRRLWEILPPRSSLHDDGMFRRVADLTLRCALKLTHDATVAVADGSVLLASIEMEKVANRPRWSAMADFKDIEDVLRGLE